MDYPESTDYPETYELVFQAPAVEDDVVVVHRTERSGAGGYPIYEDETGIVRAEVSADGEVRMSGPCRSARRLPPPGPRGRAPPSPRPTAPRCRRPRDDGGR
jgi:hypothetical protein